jgi:DNA-directed RNA polymerase subunit K/omega
MSDISDYEGDEIGTEASVESPRVQSEASDDAESSIEESGEEDVEQPFDIKSVSDYNKEVNIVPADDRMTRNVLSVAEMTAITSIRAAQIQRNNNCLVDTSGLIDPRTMARRELMEGKCPLYVRRRVDTGDGVEQYYEIWDPNVMAYAIVYTDI